MGGGGRVLSITVGSSKQRRTGRAERKKRDSEPGAGCLKTLTGGGVPGVWGQSRAWEVGVGCVRTGESGILGVGGVIKYGFPKRLSSEWHAGQA